jgi:aconitate hydratase
MLPFIIDKKPEIKAGDFIYIEGIREAVKSGAETIEATVIGKNLVLTLRLPGLTDGERAIILDGCLINHYRGTK